MHALAMRRRLAAPVAVGLLALVAGCGGDDADAAQGPSAGDQATSSTPSATSSPTEAATPTPTPRTRPLSRFEGEPWVEATRAYYAAVARSINEGERDLASARSTMVEGSAADLAPAYAEDFGTYFPGPVPFTPVRIQDYGNKKIVFSCEWADGWSLDRETELPALPKDIIATAALVTRVDGTWLVEDISLADHDCAQVKVKGVPW